MHKARLTQLVLLFMAATIVLLCSHLVLLTLPVSRQYLLADAKLFTGGQKSPNEYLAARYVVDDQKVIWEQSGSFSTQMQKRILSFTPNASYDFRLTFIRGNLFLLLYYQYGQPSLTLISAMRFISFFQLALALIAILLSLFLCFLAYRHKQNLATLTDGLQRVDTNGPLRSSLKSFNDVEAAFLQLEHTLQKCVHQNKYFTVAFNATPIVVCNIDKKLSFTYISASFATLLGYPDATSMQKATGNSLVALVGEIEIGNSKKGAFSFARESLWIGCSYHVIEEGKTVVCTASDITKFHEAMEQLNTANQRYQFMLEQTDEVIFEWGVQQASFLFTSHEKNWIRMFGSPLETNANLVKGKLYQMHPQDKVRFMASMKEMINRGYKHLRIEVRLSRQSKEETTLFWTKFILWSVCNEEGIIERIAGRIQDIDREKQEAQQMQSLVQLDPLTNLLNRRGLEASIKRILHIADPKLNSHMLVMLDIDDFKIINDTKGHQVGDQMLIRLAEIVREPFSSTDVIGRLGGDEFALLLVNFHDRKKLHTKLTALMQAIQTIGITCSIGVACFPDNGTNFSELYQKADAALYQVKKSGKNNIGYA
ncbi:MAG: diguanylate cyclase [Sphaerochaetaceae bacterium]